MSNQESPKSPSSTKPSDEEIKRHITSLISAHRQVHGEKLDPYFVDMAASSFRHGWTEAQKRHGIANRESPQASPDDDRLGKIQRLAKEGQTIMGRIRSKLESSEPAYGGDSFLADWKFVEIEHAARNLALNVLPNDESNETAKSFTSGEAPDCGDNSCRWAVKKGGMRTNGGCRCLRNNPKVVENYALRCIKQLETALAEATKDDAYMKERLEELGAALEAKQK